MVKEEQDDDGGAHSTFNTIRASTSKMRGSANSFVPQHMNRNTFMPQPSIQTNPTVFEPGMLNPNNFYSNQSIPNFFNASSFSPNAFNPSAFNPSAFNPSAFNPSAFNPNAFESNDFNSNSLSPNPVNLMAPAFTFGQVSGQMNNFLPNQPFQSQGSSSLQQSNNRRMYPPRKKESWNSTCKRCRRHGHNWASCMMASSTGWLTGCPRCETGGHNYDECPSIKKDKFDDWKFVFLCRIGRPPLWTRIDPRTLVSGKRTFYTYKQELERQHQSINPEGNKETQGDKPVASAPWTTTFAKANSQVYLTHYYYDGKPNSEVRIADPAWKSEATIKDTELYNATLPGNQLLRPAQPETSTSQGTPYPPHRAGFGPSPHSTAVDPANSEASSIEGIAHITIATIRQVAEMSKEHGKSLMQQNMNSMNHLAEQRKESSIAMSKQGSTQPNALPMQKNSHDTTASNIVRAKRKFVVEEGSADSTAVRPRLFSRDIAMASTASPDSDRHLDGHLAPSDNDMDEGEVLDGMALLYDA